MDGPGDARPLGWLDEPVAGGVGEGGGGEAACARFSRRTLLLLRLHFPVKLRLVRIELRPVDGVDVGDGRTRVVRVDLRLEAGTGCGMVERAAGEDVYLRMLSQARYSTRELWHRPGRVAVDACAGLLVLVWAEIDMGIGLSVKMTARENVDLRVLSQARHSARELRHRRGRSVGDAGAGLLILMRAEIDMRIRLRVKMIAGENVDLRMLSQARYCAREFRHRWGRNAVDACTGLLVLVWAEIDMGTGLRVRRADIAIHSRLV